MIIFTFIKKPFGTWNFVKIGVLVDFTIQKTFAFLNEQEKINILHIFRALVLSLWYILMLWRALENFFPTHFNVCLFVLIELINNWLCVYVFGFFGVIWDYQWFSWFLYTSQRFSLGLSRVPQCSLGFTRVLKNF